MIPAAVSPVEEDGAGEHHRLREYLRAIGFADAWRRDARTTPAEIAFAGSDALTVRRIRGVAQAEIDVGFSGRGYLDVVPKSLLGARGALFLTEGIIKGLDRLV
jgi:hypothetical protein